MQTNLLFTVLTYSLLPVAAATLGATISCFRPPGSKIRSMIQHFAAGVVFSVVGVELLPSVMREHRPIQVVIGFALGVIVMLGIRSMTGASEGTSSSPEEETESEGKLPLAMLVAVAIDTLVDGFLIGIGFAAGAKEGKLLTMALTIELLSLGLAVSVTLRKARASRLKAILTVCALTLMIVVGALAGATLLRGLSDIGLELVLSFGLAALLFLVTEELLVEAHEEPETPMATATFFAGFLLFLVLGMVS